MSAARGRFRCGTIRWSKVAWKGRFYPADLDEDRRLAFYATQFDAVETDATYYGVPHVDRWFGWNAQMPAEFRMAAKFPGAVVHGGDPRAPDAERLLLREHVGKELDDFLGFMSPFGGKCGPLLLQFPPFSPRVFAKPEAFLARLDRFLGELPREFRYAVELRNGAWIGPPLFALLGAHRVAWAWVDFPRVPLPTRFGVEALTTDFAYVRLMGARCEVRGVESAAGASALAATSRLPGWARLCREALAAGRDVFAFASDHFAGHGPATARELTALVARA
ncbi:MAG: DUF72 domain-containing protein [Planctomycetes bacterium]|nr:DUF72 domain-containing protein [Planctomycetota bacterium]